MFRSVDFAPPPGSKRAFFEIKIRVPLTPPQRKEPPFCPTPNRSTPPRPTTKTLV